MYNVQEMNKKRCFFCTMYKNSAEFLYIYLYISQFWKFLYTFIRSQLGWNRQHFDTFPGLVHLQAITLVILATRIIEDIVGAAMNHCEDDTGGPAQCARSIGHINHGALLIIMTRVLLSAFQIHFGNQ